ncbi:DUF4870 domain-containing protein [Staphylococcus intermedius]|uniref:Uncharacterized protein conserved in bacteria n=1 Tax=Staphylococcus intermedius NCTC 11048 TaxID=1141106 RepID=A0A380G5E9_STAIN|nr:DUF4870 domain-containing protein [Staphylococcus intermedius]PCF64195.1 hypothetical protein B5C04_09490 [Staphylococcus intermedius]PCF78910.1 hypothetical protein B4W74_09840 [Staphylococcus intermedius]PCF79882.1 hypothetical protein B4W70_09480 [Staphylococcus intermedius]PCF89458.1 hypothetical protein B4W75_01065 [Staphylococcus intermedius]PNZ50899.1 DUF4870 domain-containing protein [Staphylococcus intermedius NCTC 11048]
MSTTSEKLLACLSYFSVFFAPVLFPLIVWLVAPQPVSAHGKKALLYHILPTVFSIIAFACFIAIVNTSGALLTTFLVIVMIITIVGSLYYIVYNLYSGIKVLVVEQI